MSYLTESELNAAVREVMKRTVIDPEFRALAVKDGNAAITKASGKSVPKDSTLRFVSNHDNKTKTFNLPDPMGSGEALSEEALEQVAGGSCEATSCGTSKVEDE